MTAPHTPPAAPPAPPAGSRIPPRRHPRLPELVPARDHRYRLVRAWPRGTGHALLELAAEDGATVAGQWFADPAALESAAAATPAPAQVVGDVLLQPRGADARLRALPDVLAEDGAHLVAHRPGRRAVVRLDAQDGSAREFAKIVRRSRAADLARRGSLVVELVGDAVPVPRLLDTAEVGRGVLRWSVVPGRTLHDRGSRPWDPEVARAAWETAGRAVRHLHEAPRDRVTAHHGATEELGAAADWLRPAVVHGLLDPVLVARAGRHVTAALDGEPDDPLLGVLHRDLHDKQLLLDDAGTVGMIDVDTLAVGERALDVANLLVHLELRQAQSLLTPALAAAARTGFLAGVGDVPEARVSAYASATRLRLAGVYAFRPRWRGVAADLLRQVADRP